MKKIAILQSNYIPWKGYFDLMAMADEFILYDDVQYTRRDWRNRNTIKKPNGSTWLTIPVEVKGRYLQKISDTVIADNNWAKKHWAAISSSYNKAKHFDRYKALFESYYTSTQETHLSKVNYQLISIVNSILGINTKLSWSADYELAEGQTKRLVHLVQQAGGTEYISGPAAKEYIDEQLFTDAGIKLTWIDYSGYPEYTQLYPPFDHYVSVLDLIFNEGPDAGKYMKYVNHG